MAKKKATKKKVETETFYTGEGKYQAIGYKKPDVVWQARSAESDNGRGSFMVSKPTKVHKETWTVTKSGTYGRRITPKRPRIS